MRIVSFIFVMLIISSCTVQKVYTDGKVVKDSLKVKVAGFEIKKAN
jgi:hypothetical protein